MKAIQKELGEIGDDSNDLDQLLNKIKSLKLPTDANEKAMSEFNKLKNDVTNNRGSNCCPKTI